MEISRTDSIRSRSRSSNPARNHRDAAAPKPGAAGKTGRAGVAVADARAQADFNATMSRGGFRFTKQRREVYDALLDQRDHPTATDLFLRVKDRLPHISLATIYNCLETLVQTGLVKQVTVERGPSRYCPNLKDHGHFHCTGCGAVIDVSLPAPARFLSGLGLPDGAVVTGHEFTLHGLCPDCSGAGR